MLSAPITAAPAQRQPTVSVALLTAPSTNDNDSLDGLVIVMGGLVEFLFIRIVDYMVKGWKLGLVDENGKHTYSYKNCNAPRSLNNDKNCSEASVRSLALGVSAAAFTDGFAFSPCSLRTRDWMIL